VFAKTILEGTHVVYDLRWNIRLNLATKQSSSTKSKVGKIIVKNDTQKTRQQIIK
jgi:hypothetical protein